MNISQLGVSCSNVNGSGTLYSSYCGSYSAVPCINCNCNNSDCHSHCIQDQNSPCNEAGTPTELVSDSSNGWVTLTCDVSLQCQYSFTYEFDNTSQIIQIKDIELTYISADISNKNLQYSLSSEFGGMIIDALGGLSYLTDLLTQIALQSLDIYIPRIMTTITAQLNLDGIQINIQGDIPLGGPSTFSSPVAINI
jgi:hypothetical protein